MIGISDISHVIQVAVAPVFLLMAVASVLIVLTNRLARIVDRARALDERVETVDDAHREQVREDLVVLAHRARLVNGAITLAVLCALCVRGVIVMLFAGAVLQLDNSRAIALLFIAAMVCFIAALAGFLRETYLATSTLRFGRRR
jgi:Na+/melibiose symporter-like transporter